MLKIFNVENHGQTFVFSGGIVSFNNNQLLINKGNRMNLLIFTNRLT